jgi:hypothetical protein
MWTEADTRSDSISCVRQRERHGDSGQRNLKGSAHRTLGSNRLIPHRTITVTADDGWVTMTGQVVASTGTSLRGTSSDCSVARGIPLLRGCSNYLIGAGSQERPYDGTTKNGDGRCLTDAVPIHAGTGCR